MPAEFVDPYLYPGSNVLRNKLGLHDQADLDEAEYGLTWVRRQEMAVRPIPGHFDLAHLQAMHHYLFQDLFEWAGEIRTVDISKGDSHFHPSSLMGAAEEYTFGWLHESSLMDRLVDERTFIEDASELLSRINFMHPFREGNGRTQRAFLDHVAAISGRTLTWRNVTPREHIRASIETVRTADGRPFEPLFAAMLEPAHDGLSLLDDGLYRSSAPTTAVPPKWSAAMAPGARRPPAVETCGAMTNRGEPCRRRGRCPHHKQGA